jgi:predicted glycosyltransferase
LAARELDISNDFPMVMVLGPFMKTENRERIRLHASALANISVLDFESKMETLVNGAAAVVGMCGYNTFCEVLSFDKKALFVPRVKPRQEQYIRASRARELGWCEMLTPEEAAIPKVLAQMLNRLPNLNLPSQLLKATELGGLDTICADIAQMVHTGPLRPNPNMREPVSQEASTS